MADDKMPTEYYATFTHPVIVTLEDDMLTDCYAEGLSTEECALEIIFDAPGFDYIGAGETDELTHVSTEDAGKTVTFARELSVLFYSDATDDDGIAQAARAALEDQHSRDFEYLNGDELAGIELVSVERT